MELIVHGGAGPAPDAPEARAERLEAARGAGRNASDPRMAARRAVRVLETAPPFNAGVGSAVQADGRIRTDAGLMSSAGWCGAACAMPGVEHAVDVAAGVASETPHVLVAGDGALALAETLGVDTDVDLWTRRTSERWAGADPPSDGAARLAWIREHFGGTDTVGAVATDGEELAAATSTGGRWFAAPGRVGDVPQVGAGFFATEAAAVSATGHGEAIARFGLARRIVDAVEAGATPEAAAEAVLGAFAGETGATAGVIVVDRRGRTGRATNAERMQTA